MVTTKNVKAKPATLSVAKKVEAVKVGGFYDNASQTWSNRKFETAASKKHNEDM